MNFNKIKPVNIKQPHFVWPEKNDKIATSLKEYYLIQKLVKNGLPILLKNSEKTFKKK